MLDGSIEQVLDFKQLFLQDLQEMKHEVIQHVAIENQSNNLLEAMAKSADFMCSYCRNLKYNKTVIVVTNSRGPKIDLESQQSKNDLDYVVSQYSANNIKLSIIDVDFEKEAEEGEEDTNTDDDNTKTNNEHVLKTIAEQLVNVNIVSAEYANSLAYNTQPKVMDSTRRFYGRLTLGNLEVYPDVLNLEVEAYNSVVSTHPLTAKSVTLKQDEKEAIKKELEDANGAELEAENEMEMYKYEQLPTETYFSKLDNSIEHILVDQETGEETVIPFDHINSGPFTKSEAATTTTTETTDGITKETLVKEEVTQEKSAGYRFGKEIHSLAKPDTEVLLQIQSGPDPHCFNNASSIENHSDNPEDSKNAVSVYRTNRLLEIIGFVPANKVPKWFGMSAPWYVVANKKVASSVLGLSALVRALCAEEKCAVVRMNASSGGVRGTGATGGGKADTTNRSLAGQPEMRLLVPYIATNTECLISVKLPYDDDVNYLQFAPLGFLIKKENTEDDDEDDLDNLHSASGSHELTKRGSNDDDYPRAFKKQKLVFEHDKLLPTDQQQRAMDALVDSMDLMTAGEEFEGERTEWGVSEHIKNPLIARIKDIVKSAAIGKPGEDFSDFVKREQKLIKNIFKEKVLQAKAEAKAEAKEAAKNADKGTEKEQEDEAEEEEDTIEQTTDEPRLNINSEREIAPVPETMMQFSKPPEEFQISYIFKTVDRLFGTERAETKEEKRERNAKENEKQREENRVFSQELDIEALLEGELEEDEVIKKEATPVIQEQEQTEAQTTEAGEIEQTSVVATVKKEQPEVAAPTESVSQSFQENSIVEELRQKIQTAFNSVSPDFSPFVSTPASIFLTDQHFNTISLCLEEGCQYVSGFCALAHNTQVLNQMTVSLKMLRTTLDYLEQAIKYSHNKQQGIVDSMKEQGKNGQAEVEAKFGYFYTPEDKEEMQECLEAFYKCVSDLEDVCSSM